MKIQELIDLHTNQNYGDFQEKIPYQRIIDQYERFPNEAVYLVDCKNAQIEPLTKQFSKIIGIDKVNSDALVPLYEHVNKDEFDTFLKYTKSLVSIGFMEDLNHIPEKDVFTCVYKSREDKIS